jgi:hypothetical protein
MAEHLWIIPVSGGGKTGDPNLPNDINVQWEIFPWPDTTLLATIVYDSLVAFMPATSLTTSSLMNCNGKWTWTSQASGGNVTVGNQLLVGTVFSADLDVAGAGTSIWDTVEVWIKYRTSNKDRFSSFKVVVNNEAGVRSPSGNDIGAVSNNAWHVTKHTVDVSAWDSVNLRVFLEALGTSTAANVGATDLEVEWIAIRLSNEE